MVKKKIMLIFKIFFRCNIFYLKAIAGKYYSVDARPWLRMFGYVALRQGWLVRWHSPQINC